MYALQSIEWLAQHRHVTILTDNSTVDLPVHTHKSADSMDDKRMVADGNDNNLPATFPVITPSDYETGDEFSNMYKYLQDDVSRDKLLLLDHFRFQHAPF